MAPIQSSKRSSLGVRRAAELARLLALAVLASCAGEGPKTALDVPVAPRRPDGVVVEPAPAIPRALDRAPAEGIIALREPLADAAVSEVVRAYVRAWLSESVETLERLVTADVVNLDAPGGSRAQLRETWRTKMANLDYKRLAGADVVRLDLAERWEIQDFGAAGMPPPPPAMREGDLLVRVPVVTARVGQDQLFPDVLVLLLRREEGRLKIAGVGDGP